MKGKYWQKASFQIIRKRWYQKLKETGFVDAEKDVGKKQFLSQVSSNAYRQASEVIRECKSAYYSLLAECLFEDPPLDEIEKLILLRRSEGHKIKEISRELETRGERCHRQTIRFVIRRYENKWGIRKWNQAQLNPKWMRYKKKLPTK